MWKFAFKILGYVTPYKKMMGYGAFGIGLIALYFFLSGVYYDFHGEPIEQRDKCYRDLNISKMATMSIATDFDSLENELQKVAAETNNLLGNEYSRGYAKGLIDGKKDNDNNGTICFTPIY